MNENESKRFVEVHIQQRRIIIKDAEMYLWWKEEIFAELYVLGCLFINKMKKISSMVFMGRSLLLFKGKWESCLKYWFPIEYTTS